MRKNENQNPDEIVIRPAIAQDRTRILEINRQSSKARKEPSEWDRGFNSYTLEDKLLSLLIQESLNQKSISIIVIEYKRQVVGYTISFLFNPNSSQFLSNFIEMRFGPKNKELMTLNIAENDIISKPYTQGDVFNKLNIKFTEINLPYTFWFQIAIDRNYLRNGLGTALKNYVINKLSLQNKSNFIIGAVEIYPAFNIAQIGFLYRKHKFDILALINTYFNPSEEERCILFLKELKVK